MVMKDILLDCSVEAIRVRELVAVQQQFDCARVERDAPLAQMPPQSAATATAALIAHCSRHRLRCALTCERESAWHA